MATDGRVRSHYLRVELLLRFANLPPGDSERFWFKIGLSAPVNHAEPAALAPDQPLNSNVHGLRWSWQGGCVFLAFEGDWIKTEGGVPLSSSVRRALVAFLKSLPDE